MPIRGLRGPLPIYGIGFFAEVFSLRSTNPGQRLDRRSRLRADRAKWETNGGFQSTDAAA